MREREKKICFPTLASLYIIVRLSFPLSMLRMRNLSLSRDTPRPCDVFQHSSLAGHPYCQEYPFPVCVAPQTHPLSSSHNTPSLFNRSKYSSSSSQASRVFHLHFVSVTFLPYAMSDMFQFQTYCHTGLPQCPVQEDDENFYVVRHCREHLSIMMSSSRTYVCYMCTSCLVL